MVSWEHFITSMVLQMCILPIDDFAGGDKMRFSRMKLAAGMLLLATTAFTQPQSIELQLDQPQDLTWSSGNALTLRWDEVVADSRCPKEAVCVWAGEIELRLSVTVAGAHSPVLVLRLPERDDVGSTGTVAGFAIRLDQMDPDASLASPPTAETYRAHLTVVSPGTLLPKAVTAVTPQGWAHFKLQMSADIDR